MNNVIKVPKKIFGFDWSVERNQYVCNRIEIKEFFCGVGFSQFVGDNPSVVADFGRVKIKNYFCKKSSVYKFFFDFVNLLLAGNDIPSEGEIREICCKQNKVTFYSCFMAIKCEIFKVLYYFYFQVFDGAGDFFYYLKNRLDNIYLFIKNRRILENSLLFFDKNDIDGMYLCNSYNKICRGFEVVLSCVGEKQFDIGLCLISWNLMLYCGCRISSIKSLKIDEMKKDTFELTIHKQVGGEKKVKKYPNIGYIQNFLLHKFNRMNLEFSNVIYKNTPSFVRPLSRKTLEFIRSIDVGDEFIKFCEVLSSKTHIGRHLCINKLLQEGWTCEQVSWWTGQSAETIKSNYRANAIEDLRVAETCKKMISFSPFFKKNS